MQIEHLINYKFDPEWGNKDASGVQQRIKLIIRS